MRIMAYHSQKIVVDQIRKSWNTLEPAICDWGVALTGGTLTG